MKICVVGCGYVGLVTGSCLAEIGHQVVCVDSDKKKIAALKAGKVPIHEPGLEAIFVKNARHKRLSFASSIKEGMRIKNSPVEVVFIAVGTPPREDGSADLSAVENVAAEVAKNLSGYAVIVDKSTVPVETGEWVYKTAARLVKKGLEFDVVSNPEFLSEGSAVKDFMNPDRIVLGVSSPRAEKIMRKVYEPLRSTVLVTDVKSAELIKHASNSFLAMKISYINAVSILCEKVGADVGLVAKGMGLDHRIGSMFFNAGVGFGGFCFPKDLEAFYWIARKKGYDFQMLKAVKEVNEFQKTWIIRKLEEHLWNLEGKTVAMLGLAFKPNTDDMRFAPSLDIALHLKDRGVRVRATDPVALDRASTWPQMKGVTLCKDVYQCVQGADAVAVVTEWPEFKAPDFKRIFGLLKNPLVLDGRNLYDPQKMRSLGFTYCGVGRP